ncbi:hypothetical protein ACFQY0_14505 [Haloferula chungangensis]|uniref:DUF304 domain-containing protein n=1 Tax=Haloferula chungangensis TaxID=1048331 RepID=A0ABW2LBQ5_9BACT
MTNTTPHTFEIAIDRDEFIRHHATLEAIAFSLLLSIVMFIVALFCQNLIVEETTHSWLPMISMLACVSAAAIITFLMGCLYKRTIGHYRASRRADQFKASVEGAFLRIIDLKSDRKIHFRQIVDYQIKDRNDSDIGLLSMMTTAGGQQNSTITIPAIKNALATRDLLAEVDAQRE